MIPYEQLAAALERRAESSSSDATSEDNTFSGGASDPSAEFEIGEVLTEEGAN